MILHARWSAVNQFVLCQIDLIVFVLRLNIIKSMLAAVLEKCMVVYVDHPV